MSRWCSGRSRDYNVKSVRSSHSIVMLFCEFIIVIINSFDIHNKIISYFIRILRIFIGVIKVVVTVMNVKMK